MDEIELEIAEVGWQLEKPFLELFLQSAEEILTDRQYNILIMRYGLMDGETQTLATIGQHFGVSRERIRQIELQITRRLKGAYHSQKSRNVALHSQIKTHVRDCLHLDEAGAEQRMIAFAEQHLYGIPRAMILLLRVVYHHDASTYVEVYENYLTKTAKKPKTAKIQKSLQLLFGAIWAPQVKYYTLDALDLITPQRSVSSEGRGKAGTFFSDKLRTYVEYESQLEMFFYQSLETIEEVVSYRVQPFAIEYEWQGSIRLYYPDAIVLLNDGRCVVVEVKQRYHMALHINLAKWSALRTFCASRGYGLLVTNGHMDIRDLMRHPVDEAKQKLFLNVIDRGPLSWKGYKALRVQCSLQWSDFVSLILKHQLVWTLHPFKVSRRLENE